MARNLVEEKKREAEVPPIAEAPKEEVKQDNRVALNAVDAVIIERLDIIIGLVLEGFKQVGVKYPQEAKKD